MTDTTCPSCDAPAPARARTCARCGYDFFEDGGGRGAVHLPRPDRATLTIGAVAAGLIALAAVALAILLTGGGDGGGTATGASLAASQVTILSDDPVGRRGLERILEEYYLPVPDDDEADVTCSSRIPEPAHSIRRCRVHYPGGAERRIAVLTNARGQEVLSKP
jgi:ribosomal protein L40E